MRRILSRRMMPDTQPIKDYLCVEFSGTGEGKVWTVGDGPGTDYMEYLMMSRDGIHWETTTRMQVPAGGKVYIKGKGSSFRNPTTGKSWNICIDTVFNYHGDVVYATLSGNIMSLFYDDDFEDKTEVGDYAFFYLFQAHSTNHCIVDISNLKLPATKVGKYAYSHMFDCRNTGHPFTKPPKLPATTLGEHCYDSMFEASRLTEMPELPATTLAPYCYANMFAKSYNLKDLKQLPAIDLTGAEYCYYGMFSSCSAIEHLPHNMLPATTLAPYCYKEMFGPWYSTISQSYSSTVCSSLKMIPSDLLPATELIYIDENNNEAISANNCYEGMFYKAGIVQIPDRLLPASILSEACYKMMFSGCKFLTRIPRFLLHSAENLAVSCYESMFSYSGVTKLPSELLPSMHLAEGCYKGMFNGVSIETMPSSLLPAASVPKEAYSSMFAFCQSLETIPQGLLPATNIGEKAYSSMFRGCNALITIGAPLIPEAAILSKDSCYYMFSFCSALEEISKNLLPTEHLGEGCYMSMFTNCAKLKNTNSFSSGIAEGCYVGMFYQCSLLIDAEDLPATSLSRGCYTNMFSGCTSLVHAPAISATVYGESSCSGMFSGCEALTDPPALTITRLSKNSFSSMFSGCKALRDISNIGIQNVTELAEYCYQNMFGGCIAITSLSGMYLPAAVLADGCYYNMFTGCTGLTTVPEDFIRATNFSAEVCCKRMFYSCKALSIAPYLNPTNLIAGNGAFREMFAECYDTAVVNDETVYTGITRMAYFSGESVAKLPFTTLGNCTYQSMFANCKALTETPLLYATTVYTQACLSMFEGCESLRRLSANLFNGVVSVGHTTYEWASKMFKDCKNLKDIPSNIFENQTVSSKCFTYMFSGCEELVTAPALPTIDGGYSAYQYMFENCTKLKNAPALPSTNIYDDYEYMFKGCSALEVAPALPATSRAQYRSMFENCVSLHECPVMSMNGGMSGYDMFKGCISLTSFANVVFNNTSWVANNMFSGCSSLKEGSVVRGTDAYPAHMFDNCTSLDEVKIYLTYTANAGSGLGKAAAVFSGCTNLTTVTGSIGGIMEEGLCYGMFSDCENLTTAPTLNFNGASVSGSFAGMFKNCKKLTSVPGTITLTRVAYEVCKEMFSGCEKLTSIPTFTVNTNTAEYACYQEMFKDCKAITSAFKELTDNLAVLQSGYCYYGMYDGCTNLTGKLPAGLLPAEASTSYCYQRMFKNTGITGMEDGSMVLKTFVGSSCCFEMFAGCKNLASVYCVATNPSTSYTSDWLNGAGTDVQGEKTFTQKTGVTWPSGVSGIPEGWTAEYVNN